MTAKFEPVVLEAERLRLRELTAADAPFIFELLNDPGWIRFIGDKNIRSEGDARAYIENGPRAMYAARGFGLWLVEAKTDGTPMGLCGLIKRDSLEDIDLGFAFLPAFRKGGYAREASMAALAHAKNIVGVSRVVAITTRDNESSMNLLGKCGFALEKTIPMGTEVLNLFGVAL